MPEVFNSIFLGTILFLCGIIWNVSLSSPSILEFILNECIKYFSGCSFTSHAIDLTILSGYKY